MTAIIDLFAGAGGLSLGAARAGFDLASAVELDPFAFKTHSKNFPASHHISRDVAGLTGHELLRESRLLPGGLTGLIGGPPCQGFSHIGKRSATDLRNTLFGHFFRLVGETQPAFFLAENVPGILDERHDGLRKEAFALAGPGYTMLPALTVKANEYGAPTTRKRIFFFGYRPVLFRGEFTHSDFAPDANLSQIRVEPALDGLPSRIDQRWHRAEQGWRPVEQPTREGRFFLRATDHCPPKVGNPDAIARYKDRLVSGCLGTYHTAEVKKRYAALKFGETDKISKSKRLDPDGFCPTLRAGTGSDKGSYQAVRPIHYRSPRVITPREAARLQGFPDWFVFDDTKWHSFRQIGNSVSPLVAEWVLRRIFLKLQG